MDNNSELFLSQDRMKLLLLEADDSIGAAITRIEEATLSGASRVCSVIVGLLEAARIPLRRLGGLQ